MGNPKPSKIPNVRDFNDKVGIDCFYVRDANKKGFWCLSMVDLSTTDHIAAPCESHKPEHVAEVMESLWFETFGPPQQLVIDQDGAFKSVFLETMEPLGTMVTSCAGAAHWQHGRVERQGAWLKELARRTADGASAQGRKELKWVVTASCAAKISLR